MIHPDTPIGEISEKGLIRHLRARMPAGPGVTVGPGDDAALVETSESTLITTDALVEGSHFRREWSPPRLLGRKALSVNLSDIAAMAGAAQYATVSMCLRAELPLSFVDGVYDGLLERAAETGVTLVGGNLAATGGPIVIDVTLLGRAGTKTLRRAGAVADDLAVVTGSLGAAAAGLRLLVQGARLDAETGLESLGVWTDSAATALVHCLRAQLDPTPPLAFAQALSEHDLVHAAIDLSDGLSGDLLEMCLEGGISAWVDADAVPVDALAASLERARGGDARTLALHGGEDYQLLMAVAPDSLPALRDLAVVWNLPLAVVGGFKEGGEPDVLLKDGDSFRPLPTASHDHFRHPRSTRRPLERSRSDE